jgi:hypothetical protein
VEEGLCLAAKNNKSDEIYMSFFEIIFLTAFHMEINRSKLITENRGNVCRKKLILLYFWFYKRGGIRNGYNCNSLCEIFFPFFECS